MSEVKIYSESNIDGHTVAILKKDIVIPAGTVFGSAPTITRRSPENYIQTCIGLTKDSSGDLDYYIDPDDSDLKEWFEIIKPER